MAGFYTNNNYVQATPFPPGSSGVQPQVQQQQQEPSRLWLDTNNAGLGPHSAGGIGHRYDHPHTSMNYNHMPYSSGIPSSIITTLSSVGSVAGGLCVTAPGSFTFTSPTRLSYMASSISQTQPYGHFSSSSGWSHNFAPGLGVPWQHTVPSLMPWTDSGSTAVPPTFTGSVAQNYTDLNGPVPCALGQELPSCSNPPRRPKRHAVQNSCDIPSKQHITEEKMTASMQGLSLACASNPSPSIAVSAGTSNNINDGSAAEITAQSSLQRSWQKFRELEEMLSEDEVRDSSSPPHQEVCIQMPSSVASNLLSSPILPKEVVDTLNKQCMQVVLWKAPAERLGEVVSEKVQRNQSRKGGVVSQSRRRDSLTARSGSGVTSCSTSLNTPISSTTSPFQPPSATDRVSLDEEEDSAMEL